MWLLEHDNYQGVLRAVLDERQTRNGGYSLRAFARDVGLAPSTLAEVLKGSHSLSRSSAVRIAENLGWCDEEADFFMALVDRVHPRSEARRVAAEHRLAAAKRNEAYHRLQLDRFKVISDWYHFAIMELTTLPEFNPSCEWIANTLEITYADAQIGIERLLRLGLLERHEGSLRLPKRNNSTPSDTPSAALKRAQGQLLLKADSALKRQPVDERHVTSLILSFDSEKIAQAKAEIDTFIRKFDAQFGPSSNKDSVQCLAIQFFRLGKKIETV